MNGKTILGIAFSCLLAWSPACRAETGRAPKGFTDFARNWFATLDVRVVDDETGLIIPSAEVVVPRLAYEPGRIRGRFRYERLRKGDEPFEVLVSAPGYESQRHEVISPGEDRLLNLTVRLKRAFDEAARTVRPEVEVLRPRPGEPLGDGVAVAVRFLPLESVLGSRVTVGFYDVAGRRVVSAEARRLHGAVWGSELDLSGVPEGPLLFFADVKLDGARGRVSHLVKTPNVRRAAEGLSRLPPPARPARIRFIRPDEDMELEDRLIVMAACEEGSQPVEAVRFAAFRIGGKLRVLGAGRPSKDRTRWGFSWRKEGFLPGRYRVVATALGAGGKVLGEASSAVVRIR